MQILSSDFWTFRTMKKNDDYPYSILALSGKPDKEQADFYDVAMYDPRGGLRPGQVLGSANE